ncbi:hypothetical protein [Candidatus Electronema sp. TJ]|uniref:hypothetical protein n=1 Tax=Candidatus Electronema sp. TJ TaxID=3401573 RepID=UPI003AA92238
MTNKLFALSQQRQQRDIPHDTSGNGNLSTNILLPTRVKDFLRLRYLDGHLWDETSFALTAFRQCQQGQKIFCPYGDSLLCSA